jgi:ABC-type uncharacterized transport system substrate-binding protein
MPTITISRAYVEAGGLMSLGPNDPALYRQAADYVDKILSDAKPGDLPVENPTIFEMIFNSRTAQTLGITLPADVAAQVTDWV